MKEFIDVEDLDIIPDLCVRESPLTGSALCRQLATGKSRQVHAPLDITILYGHNQDRYNNLIQARTVSLHQSQYLVGSQL